jgi:hypothetical protein
MKGSFKTALIAAVVSGVVSVSAAAATTQTFVLGTTNRVNAPTKATNVQSNGTTVNPVDAPLLTLDNESTSANATPLSLVAPAGRPPFTVPNTHVKVANLNADLLDGRDSGYFLPGATVRRFGPVTVSPSGSTGDLITIGQLTFAAECTYDSDFNEQGAHLDLKSSVAGSAYADLTTSGTTNSSAAMNAGPQIYPLGGQFAVSGTQTFTPVTGEALSQNGQELFYDLYAGQNVAGATGQKCTFGGSIVVK